MAATPPNAAVPPAPPYPPLPSAPSQEQPQSPERTVAQAHVIQLRLMFATWQTHFRSLGYVKDSTMVQLDRVVCHEAVQKSVKEAIFRDVIGTNPKIWSDYVEVFRLAIPSLEQRSYGDPNNPATYDGPSSTTIVANCVSLIKDLQRLDNCLALARNVLTNGQRVQNLAAQVGFDSEVCSLINLCVKITARGYDGDGSAQDEEYWNSVVAAFKRLLITSLQFLSNLVTMNERLKLMLWVELFDNGSSEGGMVDSIQGVLQAERDTQGWSGHAPNAFYARAKAPTGTGFPNMRGEKDPLRWPDYRPFKPVTPFFFWLTYCASKIEEEIFLDKFPDRQDSDYELDAHLSPVDLVTEGLKRWRALDIGDRDQIAEKWDDIQVEPRFQEHVIYIDSWKDNEFPEDFDDDEPAEQIVRCYTTTYEIAEDMRRMEGGDMYGIPEGQSLPAPPGPPPQDIFAPPSTAEPDYRMMVSAEDGKNKLQEGKSQLLRKLDISWDAKVPPGVQTFWPEQGQPRPVKKQKPAAQNEQDWYPNGVPKEPLDHYDYDRPLTPGELDAQEALKAAESRAAAYFATEEGQARKRVLAAEVDAHIAGMRRASDTPAPVREYESAGSGEEEELDEEADEDDEEEEEEEEEDEEEEEEEEEDDYPVPGEDGRGLLTDVPLILGPNEIVVLPMLIMSGIVPPTEAPNKQKDDYSLINMYTIRCHLLLAQENGRNLLRELLIFVAAWDLREDELYFKFMVKIMEAILVNGLMPFAYGAFKETKDIISPAQAVIMKLLTKIFHSRQAFVGTPTTLNTPFRQPGDPPAPTSPLRFDVQVVHCLFSEFRQNIIPQICALVFLQGVIRMGYAEPQDFPLNLWDMERMYEGVYQYLEFFAILTDHDSWKQLMAEWEVTSELITLLRELEVAIPHGRFMSLPPVKPPLPLTQARRRLSPSETMRQRPAPPRPIPAPPGPIAVERPFELSPEIPKPVPAPGTEHLQVDEINATTFPPLPPAAPSAPLHDDPSDFEWRNLKKLCVLVLSSLVWKNKTLQDQVRTFDGIAPILYCCDHDEHNPYIREHAIMCLRFLLENNDENQKVVKEFAEKSAKRTNPRTSSKGAPPGPRVPEEVLDQRGYETFMDGKGKVGLRRKADTASSTWEDDEGGQVILEGRARGLGASGATAAGIAGLGAMGLGGAPGSYAAPSEDTFHTDPMPRMEHITPDYSMPYAPTNQSVPAVPVRKTRADLQAMRNAGTLPPLPTSLAERLGTGSLPSLPFPSPSAGHNFPNRAEMAQAIQDMEKSGEKIPKEAFTDKNVLEKLPAWMQMVANMQKELRSVVSEGERLGSGGSVASGMRAEVDDEEDDEDDVEAVVSGNGGRFVDVGDML